MHRSEAHRPLEATVSASSGKSSRSSTNNNVLLAATELYTGRSHHTIENKKIFLELARNLLPVTPVKDRRRISKLLSGNMEIPESLHAQLATDPDDLTAYPVLRYSTSLSVDLLRSLVQKGPESRRKAIVRRQHLDDSIIGDLCDYGSADIVRHLLDRNDVVFSKTHQAKLGRRSDIVAELGLELDGHNALDTDGLMGQYPHLPAALRAKAVAAAELTGLVLKAQNPSMAGRRLNRSPRRPIHKPLVQAALTKSKPRLADLVSQSLGLPLEFCTLLFDEDQNDTLMIALKSLGMNRRDVTSVLISMFGLNLNLDDVRELLRLHRSISESAADCLVKQWILQSGAVTKPSAPGRARAHAQFQESGRTKAVQHVQEMPKPLRKHPFVIKRA